MIRGLKTVTVTIISQVIDDCTTAADVEEKTTEGKGTERERERERAAGSVLSHVPPQWAAAAGDC